MAKQGQRAHKVLSSGRLAGPTKLPSGKKRAAVRKAPSTSANSGYSLYSTDSEDQVVVIHKGLDRCAALLKDILTNEDTESVLLNQARVVSTKTGSKPLAKKGNISKKVPRIPVPASHVHKEFVSSSERKAIPGSAAIVNNERDSSPAKQNQNFQPVHVPCNQHSTAMRPALCEHVQTQMSLMSGQMPQSACNGIPPKSCCPVSDHGCEGATLFNYRLPSSTPALSPQHPANTVVNQPSAPVGCYNQSVLQGGTFLPTGSKAASTVAPLQTVSSASDVRSYMPTSLPSNPSMTGYLHQACETEIASKQAHHDQQPFRNSEMLWRIEAHLAQLQQQNAESQWVDQKHQVHHPRQSDSARDEESSGKQSEGTSSEEDDVSGLDVAPVRDTSCQTSFDKNMPKMNKMSPRKTAQKVKTVKYLLGEIKALVADQEDTEVQRVISELEECVSLLPVLVGSTNIHAEIALALQPLRSENAQLRRRLRILNQQLRERERAEKESRPPDFDFELISLQSMNITLQSQLSQSQKSLELLQGKNEELLKVINDQKEENKRADRTVHEREQELLQSKQQAEIEAANVKLEVDEALAKMKSVQFKLDASEKENQILGITLRQRDAEVHRLRELTRTLQGSMAKLLSDLSTDNFRCKPGKTLTKSLLEVYEKQLQNDHLPASTSIMSYLKQLETDNILSNADPPFSETFREADGRINERLIAPDAMLTKLTVSDKPSGFNEDNALSGSLSPIASRMPSKHNTNTKSDSSTLMGDEQKLDETMYIPFASSPSKTELAAPERRMCTPPRIDIPSRSLDSNKTSGLENHKCARGSIPQPGRSESAECNGNLDFTKKGPCAPEMIGCRTKLEEWLPAKPRETIKDFTAELSGKVGSFQSAKCLYSTPPYQQAEDPQITDRTLSNSSFSMIDIRPGKSDWSMSSFSTFTSHDEQDFRDGLADLDANIARLQRTLQASFPQK